jgi:hypothetical protein
MTCIWLTLEQHLALFRVHQTAAHLVPSYGSKWVTNPLLGFCVSKTDHFQGKLFTSSFFASLLRMGDVVPTTFHGVEHHIHMGGPPPPRFRKSCHLNPKKLEIAKAEFKRLESNGIVCRSKSPWRPTCTWCLKKMGLGGIAVTIAFLIL